VYGYTEITLSLNSFKDSLSLDRIDSSKPYEVGNIQFISTPINYMKNSMSDEQTKTYLRVISANIIDS
jgi:hypothetical protein